MLTKKLQEIRAAKEAEDRGFTLIELLVVVVIIGILVAIAIPLYLSYEHGAENKTAQSDMRNGVTAVQACYTDNNSAYPASVTVSSGTKSVLCTDSQSGEPVYLEASNNVTVTYTAPAGTAGHTDDYTVDAVNSGTGTHFSYTG